MIDHPVTTYNETLTQVANISNLSGLWKVDLSCKNVTTPIYIRTNAEIKIECTYIRIRLKQGENNILISVGEPVNISASKSLKRTVKLVE